MDAPTITLGEHTAQLQPPGALAALALSRDEAALEAEGVFMALGAAALVLCWPEDTTWPARPRPRPWRVGQPLERYGHQAFDALVAAGVDLSVVVDACVQAYNWSMGSLIKAGEVADAANFSEAGAGAA